MRRSPARPGGHIGLSPQTYKDSLDMLLGPQTSYNGPTVMGERVLWVPFTVDGRRSAVSP